MSNEIKVGVITYHNTSNYGAALQAVATIEAIGQLGFDAEVIDYHSPFRGDRYSAPHRIMSSIRRGQLTSAVKTLILSPGIYVRNKNFIKFYVRNLKKSSRTFRSNGELVAAATAYDTLLVGSDQVWSYKNNGGDLAYLLEFAPNNVNCCSYASSFGVMRVPESLKTYYRPLLQRMDKISVRENQGRDLVNAIAGRDAKVVVDPVLLLDRAYWEGMADSGRGDGEIFDLLYVNNNNTRACELKYTREHPKVPLRILGSFRPKDAISAGVSVRSGVGPVGFLRSIINARFVYTTSYHAVVFCLIFNKPFYVYMSGDEGRDSRIKDVLKEYSLDGRAVHLGAKSLNLDSRVDFSVFNEKWPQRRQDCLEFLEDALVGRERR